MIEVGAHVKMQLPKKQGLRTENDVIMYTRGVVEKVYDRFYLIKMNFGYRECYFKYEVIEDEEYKEGEK